MSPQAGETSSTWMEDWNHAQGYDLWLLERVTEKSTWNLKLALFLMFIYLFWEEENKWERGREKGEQSPTQGSISLWDHDLSCNQESDT